MNEYSQALPPGTTQQDVEGPDPMTFSERLEYLDEHNGDKEQYMELIKDVLFDNGTGKEDTETILNTIVSMESAK